MHLFYPVSPNSAPLDTPALGCLLSIYRTITQAALADEKSLQVFAMAECNVGLLYERLK